MARILYSHRIPLTAEQVFATCSALNQAAAQFESNIKTRRRLNQASKLAWAAEAAKLRELSRHFLVHWKRG